MHVLKFFLNTLLLIVVVAGGVFGFVHRKDLVHELSTLSTKVANRLQEVSGTQYATREPVSATKPISEQKPVSATKPVSEQKPVLEPKPVSEPKKVAVIPAPEASPPMPAVVSPQAARTSLSYPPDDYAPQPAPTATPMENAAAPPAPYYGQPLPPPGYPSQPYRGYAPSMAEAGEDAMASPSQEFVPPANAGPRQAAENDNDTQQMSSGPAMQGMRPPFAPYQDQTGAETQEPFRATRPSSVSPETRTAWVEARQAFWSQDLAKAEESYLKLIKENAAEADLPGELGNLYLLQGRADDAAEQYLEAGRRLLRGPNRSRAHPLISVLARLDHAKAEELRQEMFSQQGQRRFQGQRGHY